MASVTFTILYGKLKHWGAPQADRKRSTLWWEVSSYPATNISTFASDPCVVWSYVRLHVAQTELLEQPGRGTQNMGMLSAPVIQALFK